MAVVGDTPEGYNEDRRAQNELILTLVKQANTSIAALDTKLSTHMVEESKEWAESLTNLIKASFPQGDPDGHRRFHEASIKQVEEKAQFWTKMRYELVQKGLIAFVVWLGYSAWATFLHGPAK